MVYWAARSSKGQVHYKVPPAAYLFVKLNEPERVGNSLSEAVVRHAFYKHQKLRLAVTIGYQQCYVK